LIYGRENPVKYGQKCPYWNFLEKGVSKLAVQQLQFLKCARGHMKKSDGRVVVELCPAAQFQKMISGKYKLRILWGLKDGAQRYSEIRSGLLTGEIGSPQVAPRVLGRELKSLVETGMIKRKDYGIFPLRVEYTLTTRGKTFVPVISVMRKWEERELAGDKAKRLGRN
jgi:DNA-binding HxlR family transcriptional regulator